MYCCAVKNIPPFDLCGLWHIHVDHAPTNPRTWVMSLSLLISPAPPCRSFRAGTVQCTSHNIFENVFAIIYPLKKCKSPPNMDRRSRRSGEGKVRISSMEGWFNCGYWSLQYLTITARTIGTCTYKCKRRLNRCSTCIYLYEQTLSVYTNKNTLSVRRGSRHLRRRRATKEKKFWKQLDMVWHVTDVDVTRWIGFCKTKLTQGKKPGQQDLGCESWLEWAAFLYILHTRLFEARTRALILAFSWTRRRGF